MTLRSSSVFQAICYRHPCHYRSADDTTRHEAALVCISARTARIDIRGNTSPPGVGTLVHLAPNFIEDNDTTDIEARVDRVMGTDVQLAFLTPLPIPGSRLYQLTSR